MVQTWFCDLTHLNLVKSFEDSTDSNPIQFEGIKAKADSPERFWTSMSQIPLKKRKLPQYDDNSEEPPAKKQKVGIEEEPVDRNFLREPKDTDDFSPDPGKIVQMDSGFEDKTVECGTRQSHLTNGQF